MPFWLKLCPGFFEPNLCEKFEFEHFRTNPEPAMASSATSATSFELIEDQTLTAEEVEMASQEAQEIRTREAAVAAGLVLDEPEAPPSASATDVMNDLSSALERLRVAFSTPTSGLGAPGPAEEEDKDMEDAFVAASQKTTAQVNKPVSLVPVEGRPGYFKLVDLPDLFPVLPASAATLLRDVTVEEAVSLFHKFVGKNLTEDLVIRILEAYVPMKIQIRQEEVWASQFQRNKACIGTQRMHRLDAGHSDYKFMCKACGTGWPEAAKQCWVCPGKEFVPFQAPSATYEADGVTYNLLIVEGKPTWIQQREGGSLGAAGPGGTRAQADRNLVDGTVLGIAPPKTDTAEEITMADMVPLNRRVDIRQEILSMEADDEALKVRERQEVKVKVQRSLKEAEAQSFQLYHPQVDQVIRKKEELHKATGNRPRRSPRPGRVSWRLSRRHAGPAGPSCKISTWRGRALTPARHWLRRWAPSRRLRRRTSAPNTPTRHGCLLGSVGVRQALERGLFCPLELDDPEDMPGDILHQEAQRGAEPMEPGRDARPGDPSGRTSQCHSRT